MSSTWNHALLGRFTYNEDERSWNGTIEIPAFRPFAWDTGYSNAPRSQDWYDLSFEIGEESWDEDEDEDEGEDMDEEVEAEAEVPSPEMVHLVLEILANQEILVPAVTQALWDDFNGVEKSNMWWHGHLDRVVAAMNAEEAPQEPSDLLGEMQLSSLSVRKEFDHHDGPAVILNFHASFEEEHGVGILTDGQTILGLGYAGLD